MNSNKPYIEAGFTLPEILLVLGLLALFSTLVLPVVAPGKAFHGREGEQLERWLGARRIDVALSPEPMRICLHGNLIKSYVWLPDKNGWVEKGEPFTPEKGEWLSIISEEGIHHSGMTPERCYMVYVNGFYPAGGISLSKKGQHYDVLW